jgi:hypothetical protein
MPAKAACATSDKGPSMGALAQIELPSFGGGDGALPGITIQEYEERLGVLCRRMAQESLDVLVVYGDREHFATMAFLTGLIPV